jgi:hypothetical protein
MRIIRIGYDAEFSETSQELIRATGPMANYPSAHNFYSKKQINHVDQGSVGVF